MYVVGIILTLHVVVLLIFLGMFVALRLLFFLSKKSPHNVDICSPRKEISDNLYDGVCNDDVISITSKFASLMYMSVYEKYSYLCGCYIMGVYHLLFNK